MGFVVGRQGWGRVNLEKLECSKLRAIAETSNTAEKSVSSEVIRRLVLRPEGRMKRQYDVRRQNLKRSSFFFLSYI